jgi:sortase A
MRSSRLLRIARALELILAIAGIACLARYAWLHVELQRLEAGSRDAVTIMLAPGEPASPASGAADPARPAPDPLLIGAIDIPRLRFSAAIVSGDDAGALDAAIGYLPDSAFPWEEGNSVLAGHRDRLFRPLARIRAGDDLWLSTRHGTFRYRVDRTFIVDPADVWVLDSVPGVDLTLITCYPFVYVGHAPQRFVVRAQKVRAD